MKLKYIITLIILFAMVATGQATIFLGVNNQSFDQTENFDDDLFISGNSIRFESYLEGDLIGASRELVFSGDCRGNINWACQWITVTGIVENSIRAFAQTIDINSEIGRNLIAGAQKVVVGPITHIEKDATIFAEEVEFEGYVGHELKISASSIVLSGQIDGDVAIQAGKLTIMPNTKIGGNLSYKTPEDIKIPDTVEITGATEWVEYHGEEEKSDYRAFKPFMVSLMMFIAISFIYYFLVFVILLLFNNAAIVIITLLSLIISGLIVIKLNKNTATRAVGVLENRFLTALGLGILVILLFPFVSLIAFISFIGWPLGFILLFAFGTFSFAGAVYSSQFIGCAIGKTLNLGKKQLSAITYIIGVVIVALLSLIPIVGWLVVLVVIASGLGALILSLEKFRDKKSPLVDKFTEKTE